MDKTEITELPEDISSEELDALTTGEEVEKPENQETLDATEEDSPAEESVEDEPKAEKEEKPPVEEKVEDIDPKDAVIGDFRRKNRDLELENAKMKGEIETRKSLQVKTDEPSKSPLEIAEAVYLEENGNLDGFAMNGELYRKQRAFDDALVADKAATVKYEESKSDIDRSVDRMQADELSVEKMGDGLDFKTVIDLGQNYLDKADLMKIELVSQKVGVDAGVRKAYDLCKQAVLDADNADSKLLQNAINVKSQTKPTKNKPIDIDALTTEGEDTDKGEAETGTHSEQLASFIVG